MTTDLPNLDDHLVRALTRRRQFTTATARLLVRTREVLLLAMASALVKLREAKDPIPTLLSQIRQRDMRIEELVETNQLLRVRMSRIDARHRCRYSPEQRYQIVVHKQSYSLSAEETARRFGVSSQTISRWMRELLEHPTAKTVGSLLKAVPPLMSYSDVTKNLVQLMDRMGFGGNRRIAQTLARAGIKLGRETVRRWRKTPPPPPGQSAPGRAVTARYPNHVWMMDLTQVDGFMKLFRFRVVAVLDVFSRVCLAHRVFSYEPSSEQIAALLRGAVGTHRAPRHLVTDKGGHFTGDAFRETANALGILQRFGAVGKSGSIAIIERFWRSVKELLGRSPLPPLSRRDLIRRLDTILQYYTLYRPHQGLCGATPAEVYLGLPHAHVAARRPRRAREEPVARVRPGLTIGFLDEDKRLPVLLKAA